TPPLPSPTLFPYTTLFRSPNDGPAPGASSRWVVNFMGQKDMRMRIDELELGRKEVLQATSGPMLPRITYLFEPEKSGTRFTRKRSEEHTSELQSQSNLVCR